MWTSNSIQNFPSFLTTVAETLLCWKTFWRTPILTPNHNYFGTAPNCCISIHQKKEVYFSTSTSISLFWFRAFACCKSYFWLWCCCFRHHLMLYWSFFKFPTILYCHRQWQYGIYTCIQINLWYKAHHRYKINADKVWGNLSSLNTSWQNSL